MLGPNVCSVLGPTKTPNTLAGRCMPMSVDVLPPPLTLGTLANWLRSSLLSGLWSSLLLWAWDGLVGAGRWAVAEQPDSSSGPAVVGGACSSLQLHVSTHTDAPAGSRQPETLRHHASMRRRQRLQRSSGALLHRSPERQVSAGSRTPQSPLLLL